MAPLTRFRSEESTSAPSDLQAECYKQRASEGGLLIAETTFISRFAGVYPHTPGVYSKGQIEGRKKVTSGIYEKKNGFIYLQLWHAGRTASKLFNSNQEQVVSTSGIPIKDITITAEEYEIPHALKINELRLLLKNSVKAH